MPHIRVRGPLSLNDGGEFHCTERECLPESLVLPPQAVEDSLRWLHDWPKLGPEGTLTWLGLSSEASWAAIVTRAYVRFEDHWAAGVAYLTG
jgi:hypothetical protein